MVYPAFSVIPVIDVTGERQPSSAQPMIRWKWLLEGTLWKKLSENRESRRTVLGMIVPRKAPMDGLKGDHAACGLAHHC
ncbi:hypothetical protein [Roseivivax lentus]|uniref:hypothetical protein n=1 Tax=Roseivivax lentus TaxID=633194 RepID=UPI00117B4767|nr:hypothetical protein [Roseivivax lentus]